MTSYTTHPYIGTRFHAKFEPDQYMQSKKPPKTSKLRFLKTKFSSLRSSCTHLHRLAHKHGQFGHLTVVEGYAPTEDSNDTDTYHDKLS